MSKTRKSPQEAVDLLGLQEGQTVITFAPSTGFTEALSKSVGAKGSIKVIGPPPDLDVPKNVTVLEELPADEQAQVVIVWVGMVPAHAIRDHAARVSSGGTLWVVLPRVGREERAPVTEAEVKRPLMVAGWKDNRSVTLGTDSFAVRFVRRH